MPHNQQESDQQTSPRREHPNTYYMQDRSNVSEMERLKIQDEMITTSLGGVLVEQDDPGRFRSVIDVGCGVGKWIVGVAKEHPLIQRLVGVDISTKMLEYAGEQAEGEGVSDRVEFVANDAMRMLEFRDSSFDLVNQRFAVGWLRKWDWQSVLREYSRICKAGGVIRIIEGDFGPQTNSEALTTLFAVTREAFYQAGHLFTTSREGIRAHTAAMLGRYLPTVQSRDTVIRYSCHSADFREDISVSMKLAKPFIHKWAKLPENYEELYQQALNDMGQPEFSAEVTITTVWGTMPQKKRGVPRRD